MGMVEYLAILADDFGATPGAIEQCVDHRFGEVAELAAALTAAKLSPDDRRLPRSAPQAVSQVPLSGTTSWLSVTAVRLPDAVEPANHLNKVLRRPTGWLGRHAGIYLRRV